MNEQHFTARFDRGAESAEVIFVSLSVERTESEKQQPFGLHRLAPLVAQVFNFR
jgi:hypothetical protein